MSATQWSLTTNTGPLLLVPLEAVRYLRTVKQDACSILWLPLNLFTYRKLRVKEIPSAPYAWCTKYVLHNESERQRYSSRTGEGAQMPPGEAD